MLGKYAELMNTYIRVPTKYERSQVIKQVFRLFQHLESKKAVRAEYHGREVESDFIRLYDNSYDTNYQHVYFQIPRSEQNITAYMEDHMPSSKREVSFEDGMRLLYFDEIQLNKIYKEY